MLSRFARSVLACVAYAASAPALAQSLDDVPKIEVHQTASEEHVPDRASFRIDHQATGDTSDKVARDLAVVANRVLDTLKRAGVADVDTASSGPDIEAVYEVVKNEKGQEIAERRRQIGYRGEYRIVVTTTALDMLPALLPKVSAAGGLVQTVDFHLSDAGARRRALEEKAVADAVERAGRLIRAAGARPGRVLEIDANIDLGAAASRTLRSERPKPIVSEMLIPLRPGRKTVSATVGVKVEMVTP